MSRTSIHVCNRSIPDQKTLIAKALSKIEPILDALNIEWVQHNDNFINIICPVHGSEDLGSCSILLNSGIYKCWSHECHSKIGPNFIHLIKWAISKNAPANWSDVESFIDGGSFEIKDRVVKEYKEDEEIPLMDVCKYPTVTIPSKYYIDRGFSREVLIKYGVGDTLQNPYTNRALVPVHTEDGKLMGFSGRSKYKICPKCEFYHSKYESCIDKHFKYAHMYKKWFHSSGMKKTRTLYGIDKVGCTDKIAIVESPSCVWKLNEIEIPAGAVLGRTFSWHQASILKSRGISKVFLLADEDESGDGFKSKFISDWYNTFSITVTKLPKKDVSDMSSDELVLLKEKWNRI